MKKKRIHTPMQWFTSCVSTTLVLVLLGLVVLCGYSANKLSKDVKENFTVTLLLDDDLGVDETRAFQARLDAKPYTRSTTLITAEEALKEETERMGTNPTDFLGGKNPYTASIEMNVVADYACTDSLIWIQKELRELWQVNDVVYQQDIVENLNHTLQRTTLILAILAVLLIIISVVLVNNTVRLSVYARRHIIHTMRLVGASWAFIQRPFLRRSLGIGLTAALLATAFLLASVHWARQQDAFIQNLVTNETIAIMVGTVFISALLLSVVCTWFSVNHFLNMKENEMYR
ncbi:MAG: permease-like cell division protein FtsX [Bacteroidaceae bacterium]|nr:permease-like cell division protein FtsX [Bacteroidaceae bacterium]